MTMTADSSPQAAVPSLPVAGPAPTDVRRDAEGKISREIWDIPATQEVLEPLLREIFEEHWQGIRFGPIIEGAAYEWKCPGAPVKISLFDAYLTVMFANGGHFHLCIGENMGSPKFPTPEEKRRHRKPSRASFFRSFGRDGKPVSWGFEMVNGAGEPMISVFLPNPFIEDNDSLSETPDFSRLATWRALSARWLGRPEEALDAEGKGFRQS